MQNLARIQLTVRRAVPLQVDACMSSNRLRMNVDKTQLIWLGTKQQLDKLSMTQLDLLSARVRFSTAVFWSTAS